MKYIVSMAVDGRIDVEVEAADVNEAKEKAEEAFCDANLSKMEIVGADAVTCYDAEGNILASY